MAWFWSSFISLFSSKKTEVKEIYVKKNPPEMPMGNRASLGRETVNEDSDLYNIRFSRTPLEPTFGVEWLPLLQRYAIFNGNVSLAVDNIINLANTPYNVILEDTGKRADKKIRKILKALHKKLNLDVAINNMLRQMAINGCLSIEKVPNAKLTEIVKIPLVNPYTIRFFSIDGDYVPHQKNSKAPNGYKQLNTTTYTYSAISSDNNNPYGIPPFLAALESIGIERNLLKGFAKVAEKFGLMGFLEVLLTAPPQEENETPDAYYERCLAYLEKARPQVEKNMNSGYVMGYKDSHEFKLTGSKMMDGDNAKDIMMLNDINTMAGLKQDPNLLGRQQSRAETFGKILLTIFTSKITSFQNIIAYFLEDLFEMHLLMQGYDVNLEVKFDKPVLSDQKLEHEAQGVKIDNLMKLKAEGIISQEQFAQEMGYDKPAVETPTQPPTNQQ
ncbi:MAG: hypothetical protein MUC49_15770 [Raineya sp.]|jgi:hypothetical protein|nr:hypothetical protein [Raineya sp.]